MAPSGIGMRQLGYEALKLNRPREAIDVLGRIDLESAEMRDVWWYWRTLTRAHHMLGDRRRELKEARRGREQYPTLLSTLQFEVVALAALGRVDEVSRLLDEAIMLPPQPGWAQWRPAVAASLEFRAHGYPEAAEQAIQRAIDWFRSRPSDEAATAESRYGLARTLYWGKRWDEARTLFERLVVEVPDNGDYLGFLGTVGANLGHRDQASRVSERLAGIDLPFGRGFRALWQARIAAVLSERERAMNRLRDAFAGGIIYNTWFHRDPAFESLRDYPPFQQLMRPKG